MTNLEFLKIVAKELRINLISPIEGGLKATAINNENHSVKEMMYGDNIRVFNTVTDAANASIIKENGGRTFLFWNDNPVEL